MIGPLLRLRLLGTICPCLEKDEDGIAREALISLSSVRISWHRKVKSESSGADAAAVVSGLVSGLFGSKSGGGGGAAASSFSYVKTESTLRVADDLSGPSVIVEASSVGGDDGCEDNGDAPRHQKTVPLRRLGNVAAAETSFFGMGGGNSSTLTLHGRENGNGNQGEELLRVDVLGADGKGVGVEGRDDVVDKLNLLLHWDTRRRTADGPEDDSMEVEDNGDDLDGDDSKRDSSQKTKGRAAKAAHFAKREIEMMQQRRDREKRKARYLKEAGGLKYTAVAMANKEMA